MKGHLGKGVFRLPQIKTDGFCDRIRHSLWRREILEGWVTRLERSLNAMDESFQEYFHIETGRHFTSNANHKQTNELAQLKGYFIRMENLATEIYSELKSLSEFGTVSWAIGLPPPTIGNTISDWKIPTPVNIETRLSMQQGQDRTEHYHLRTCFQVDNNETYTSNSRVKELVLKLGDECPPLGTENLMLDPDCHYRAPSSHLTLSIGSLLKDKRQVLDAIPWLVQRPQLIYGIVEWTLLLWNTPWFDQLCCYGIRLEIGECAWRCAKSSLTRCTCLSHTTRLRNLGLVLAQLILGVPIRQAQNGNLSKFESRTNGVWETVYLSNINRMVLEKTGSLPVQSAIYFCLNPQPDLPNGDLKAGYLYMCIARIFEPSVIFSS